MPGNTDQIVRILRHCLEEASSVEIDGLGVFRRHAGGYEFLPARGPRIFIAYVEEDAAQAERLYGALRDRGFDPWLDRKKLLPGQNWPRAIQQAIEVSDFFVACLSTRAVRKKGQFQAELRYALDCARRAPLDQIYLIPVRLEDCPVPASITREIQYVDLFPDWDAGLRRVVAAIKGPNKANLALQLPSQ
ncbi:MAG: toll/interleukin-1 receptor domain-containing protein [Bryobacteraceae bacterium]